MLDAYTICMALEKKYDATPLQVLTSSETRERLRRLAAAMTQLSDAKPISQAEVFRRILDEGLPIFEARYGLGE